MGDPASEFLDGTNVRIIWELHKHGIHNISFIARELGIPKSTVYRRIARLKQAGLKVRAVPRYAAMGLIHAVVLYKSSVYRIPDALSHARENVYILECYRALGWWNGLVALAAIPLSTVHSPHRAFSAEPGHPVEVILTSDPYPLVPSVELYDASANRWIVNEQGCYDIPHHVIEDKEPMLPTLDPIDVYMINRLQEEGELRLSEIANALGISRSAATYHYSNHVLPLLADGYRVEFPKFEGDSMRFLMEMTLLDEKGMLDCLRLLGGTPYISMVFKTLRKTEIMAMGEAPHSSLSKLVSLMEKHARRLGLRDIRLTVLLGPCLFRGLPHHMYDGKRKTWVLPPQQP